MQFGIDEFSINPFTINPFAVDVFSVEVVDVFGMFDGTELDGDDFNWCLNSALVSFAAAINHIRTRE